VSVAGSRRKRAPASDEERARAQLAIGDLTPRSVCAPESPEALAELLRACDRDGRAVVFFGGGTLQGFGHAPSRYDVAISLANVAQVIAYEFSDLTIAVEAGLRAQDFDATLAAKGQFVPLDAPLPERSTVGGILASGWLGPRRAAYGRPRDFIIGASVVLADGTIAKAGGMVVKNSTGYDLSRLYVGSLGTLAGLVRANFKTLPLPQARRVALARLPDGTFRRAVAHVAALETEPTVALAIAGFLDEIEGRDGSEGRLFAMFEGTPATVERATRELRSALGAAGVPETTILDEAGTRVYQQILDAYVSRLGNRTATYRSVGLPSDVVARAEALARLARVHELEVETILDLRCGDVIARVSDKIATQFAARVVEFDDALANVLSNVRILTAPEALRNRLAMWGSSTVALAKMRELKAHFDPRNTLAPGRFVGKI
jgi:glycolate oxidase FAD binding subunit